MAKKKTMPKLIPTSDYVTTYVDKIWDLLRVCAEETKSVYPMLTYAVHGAEFSVPMSYPMFLDLGQRMVAAPILFPVLLTKMGIELAVLAMQMARSEAEAGRRGTDSGVDFVREVELILHKIKPECVVFSAPVRALRRRSKMTQEAIREAEAKARVLGPDAVAVVGRNPVRTFAVVRKFVRDPLGHFHFGEPEVLDSLCGSGQDHGYFSHVFDPNQN